MPLRGTAGARGADKALDLGPFSTGLKARFGARAIRAQPGSGRGRRDHLGVALDRRGFPPQMAGLAGSLAAGGRRPGPLP
jgi:hypothetical protein